MFRISILLLAQIDMEGSVRMICKDCGKTFTLSEHPNTRLTRGQMSALFTGIIENIPIGQLADRMGVSRSTAHRHKIQIRDILYHRMAEDLGAINDKGKPTLVFEGITQCDEWYCPVSFKGKRDSEFFIWKLRRFPRHNMTAEEQKEYLRSNGLWKQVTAIPGYLQQLRDNTKTYKCYDAGEGSELVDSLLLSHTSPTEPTDVTSDDIRQLTPTMTMEDVTALLGDTLDIGSGQYILLYRWMGLTLLTFHLLV